MKFSDLSDAVKLIVTKWLPTEVKIALVDVFPPVITQIKSVTLQQLILNKIRKDTDLLTDDDIYLAVELYNKLTKVTKITDSHSQVSVQVSREFANAIGYNLRPDIEYFFGFEVPHLQHGLKYIETLIRKYPDYDGSHIKNRFDISLSYVPTDVNKHFLERNPGLKLNLFLSEEDLNYEGQQWTADLIQDTMIQKLINSLEIESSELQQLLDVNSIQFDSLEELRISYCDAPFLVQNIEKIRYIGPLITDMKIWFGDIADLAIDTTNCILSLEHLESLTFHTDGWNDEDVSAFHSMVTTLLMAYKPSLTKLNISNAQSSLPNMIPIVLWNNIRDGFKLLKICSNNYETFEVYKNVMKICNCDVSLIDVLNKFPRVKHILVHNKDETCRQRMRDELNVIRSGLPRNRWLTLRFNS